MTRVCMVISSFRNDAEVLALVAQARELTDLFERVIVVDSLGHDGMAERVRAAAGELPAEYVSAHRNLGAAGNLKERLQRAANTGATYAYALNHDAKLDASVARKLVEVANARPNAAATYPLRRLIARGNRYDVSGLSPWPWLSRSQRKLPTQRLLPAHWSSSNGALYRLDVVRAGHVPWEDLFHGFEDIEYGWRLEAAGYEQLMVSDAIVDDNYEFASHGPLRLPIYLVAKPPWLSYYFSRNLLMASRRSSTARTAVATARIAFEMCVTVAARKNKLERLTNLATGVVDAVRGRGGKWKYP